MSTVGDEHFCYISDEEWAQYGAITGKSPEILELIKARHARELANVDPEFFPSDEHRVAYQRGLLDAYLKFEWPHSPERIVPSPSLKAPAVLLASAVGDRT